jgi:hypothetical protein
MLCKITTTLLSLTVFAATTTTIDSFGVRGLQHEVGNAPPENEDIAIVISNQERVCNAVRVGWMGGGGHGGRVGNRQRVLLNPRME